MTDAAWGVDEATPDVFTIVAGDGARATLHRNGAHLTSWYPAGSLDDRLFVSTRSAFGAGASIRGGVPVIFPQFASEGPLPKHGFVRAMPWTLVRIEEHADGARAELELFDSAETQAIWPAAFHAQLSVMLATRTLEITLAIVNRQQTPFAFTTALHSYFRVRDAYRVEVGGLSGLRYRDKVRGNAIFDETSTALAFHSEIDRVYYAAHKPIEVRETDRALRVEQRGFRDVVLWNPGHTGLRGKPDFADGEERDMLCVEAATVQHPITLDPGARWEGAQIVTAL